MTDEVPLSGGNTTSVVRRGDRVLRTAGPWTPTVQAWLRHLRSAGIDEVPEPFGVEGGREVLAHLPGEVPRYPLTAEQGSDAVLEDAGRLLRRIHDAGRDFDRAGAVWQQPVRAPAETVLVNDYGPHNLVLRDGRVAGVIDLDQAAPGPALRDVAHLAYRLVPLTAPGNPDGEDRPHRERKRRLRLLLEAYGTPDRAGVLARVPEVLTALAEHAGTATAHRPALVDHVRTYERDLHWFRSVRDDLDA